MELIGKILEKARDIVLKNKKKSDIDIIIFTMAMLEYDSENLHDDSLNMSKILGALGINTEQYYKQLSSFIIPSHKTNIALTKQVHAIIGETDNFAKQENLKITTALLFYVTLRYLDYHKKTTKLIINDFNVINILTEYGFSLNDIIAEFETYLKQEQSENMADEEDTGKSTRKTSGGVLKTFGIDLVEEARRGNLDPLIGRDKEVVEIINVLCRKRKANPCLVGEPGVGKTAIVEGLAQKIANGDVPNQLRNKRIVKINMGTLVSGTKYRGQFEERVINLIKEVEKNKNVILFIDEAHTLIGAGSVDRGSLDAADLLKPALSRGELKVITATTNDEYRKYIESDKALERRFKPIFIEENTVEETIEILNSLKNTYEKYHGVKYSNNVIPLIVKLTNRYINDRHLPDKAIDLLDEAGAFASVKNKKIVDSLTIKYLIAKWSKIPITDLEEDEFNKLNTIEEFLRSKIINQDEAIKIVAQALRNSRAGIKDPNRPTGIFLFLGSSGVGKTELAKRLAEHLFGNKNKLLRIDMSEYMEEHSISKFLGAPPGYIGYDDVPFVEQIRKNPYSVILIDELEKAHHKILNIFLQIFDDGFVKDSHGRLVSFKDTIIILTSNIGTKELCRLNSKRMGFNTKGMISSSSRADVKSAIMRELKETLRPEFLNRIDDIIIFNSLTHQNIIDIVNINIDELIQRILNDKNILIEVTQNAINYLAQIGYSEEYGAREVKRCIKKYIENYIANTVIGGNVTEKDKIIIDIKDGKTIVEIKKRSKLGKNRLTKKRV